MPFIAALVLFGLGGLYNLHIPPWTSFHNEALAFAGLAVLFLHSNRNNNTTVPHRRSPWFVLTGLMLIQTWAYPEPYAGDLALLALYGTGAVLAWQWGVHNGIHLTHTQVAQAATAMVCTGWVTSLACWAQFLNVDHHWPTLVLPLELAPRVFGNLGQPNHTATVLVSSWLVLTWLFHKGHSRWIWWCLGSAPLLGAVVLTQSRSGALSVVLGCVTGAYLSHNAKQLHGGISPLRVRHWASAGAAFVAGFFIFHHNAIQSIGTEKIAAVGNRPTIWSQIAEGLLNQPWLGYGWMRVPEAQQVGATHIPGAEVVDFSHNVLLDQWVWWGLPLTTFGLLGLGWWLLKIWRLAAPANLWPLLLLLPLGVHSTLEMPYTYAYFLWPALLLLGTWSGRIQHPQKTSANTLQKLSHPDGWHGVVSRGFQGFYVVWGLLVVVSYTQVESALREVRFTLAQFQGSQTHTPPNAGVLTHFEDALWALQLRPTSALTELDMLRLERTTRRFNWHAIHARWVIALVYQERYEEVQKHLKLIHNLFGPVMHREMVSLLANKGLTDSRFRNVGLP